MRKYEVEINQLIEEVFKEDWMTESTWQEVLELLEQNNLGYEASLLAIEEGERNGYSFQSQFHLIKEHLKLSKT